MDVPGGKKKKTKVLDDPEVALVNSLSSLDTDVVNEVVLATAQKKGEDSNEIIQRKLESIEFQEEVLFIIVYLTSSQCILILLLLYNCVFVTY